LRYARSRVRALQSLVSSLRTSEFPQPNCKEGFDLIAEKFRSRDNLLATFTDSTDPAIVHTACQDLLNIIFDLLPILGFFLRSTNVRNAFELHGPLARLARRLVANTKLVLSSEWDFSPFTFHHMSSLPHYILIGLPASESANSLALPLAGHELGHSVWADRQLDRSFKARITPQLLQEIKARWNEYSRSFPAIKDQKDLTSLFGQRTWSPAHVWCENQIKETFCDQLGVRLFGTSYLHAFAYLLAPGLPKRNPAYPSNVRRAESMLLACKRWNLTEPQQYLTNFRDGDLHLSDESRFLCGIADATSEALQKEILDQCDLVAAQCGLPANDPDETTRIVSSFGLLVPGSAVKSLASITNAGWQAFHDRKAWANWKHLENRYEDVLNELMLKSIEIFEIEALLQDKNVT
jgi:hypothetical protein